MKHSETTINSQTAETRKRTEIIVSNLSLDKKVLLKIVKKTSDQLTEISKSKKEELSMSIRLSWVY